MALTISAPVRSPSLDESGPAFLTDDQGNKIPIEYVVMPDVNGVCGLSGQTVVDGKTSQVTNRKGAPNIGGVPLRALVLVGPSGAKLPFPAPLAAFQSTVRTATGALETFAHGLGKVPSIVHVSIYDNTGVATVVVTEGVHTLTNLLITVTAGAKYKVVAFA